MSKNEEDLLNQTTGDNLPGTEGLQPGAEQGQAPILQNLPPELKDLEGKDLQTALAEVAKLKKSYAELQRKLGEQGQELGAYRQYLASLSQQGMASPGIPSNMPGVPPVGFQPTPPAMGFPLQPQQPMPMGEEDIADVDTLFKTVKQLRQQVGMLAMEKEALRDMIEAQEIKRSALSKFSDATEYEDVISLVTRGVHPALLKNPKNWEIAYLIAKSIKQAVVGGTPEGLRQQMPQPSPTEGIKATPAGESGTVREKPKDTTRLPEDVERMAQRIAARAKVPLDELKKYLKE